MTIMVADVGAGTGKLTENLIELGLHGYAVEPNDAMRGEGISYIETVQGIPPPEVMPLKNRHSYGQKGRLRILI